LLKYNYCDLQANGRLLAAFPKELVLAVAGFALLVTIGGGLATAMKEDGNDVGTREAALVTFLVTLSGLTLWGVGSAFFGGGGGDDCPCRYEE
jgi:benzoate membrane transport protein